MSGLDLSIMAREYQVFRARCAQSFQLRIEAAALQSKHLKKGNAERGIPPSSRVVIPNPVDDSFEAFLMQHTQDVHRYQLVGKEDGSFEVSEVGDAIPSNNSHS